MKAVAEEFVAERVDADNRVCVDAPCLNCGYNLRSLEADAVCTECAHPVRLSIGGELLRFASPVWARGLARGLLKVLIALAVMVGGGILLSLGMAVFMILSAASFGAGPPTGLMLTINLVQSAFYALVIGLVMHGLFRLSAPEPVARDAPERLSARRCVRWCLWLMPAPILINLLSLRYTMSAVQAAPNAPLAMFSGGFWVLLIAHIILSAIGYGVTWLGVVRMLAGLMKRIPRPGLARFARIEFWGLLASGITLAVGYAWLVVRILPIMSWFVTVAPALATTAPASGPIVTISRPGTALGAAPTSIPASGPGAVGVPLPPFPKFDVSFFLSIGLASAGALGSFGFGIACLVLLILAQRALSGAAGEAERIGQPVAT